MWRLSKITTLAIAKSPMPAPHCGFEHRAPQRHPTRQLFPFDGKKALLTTSLSRPRACRMSPRPATFHAFSHPHRAFQGPGPQAGITPHRNELHAPLRDGGISVRRCSRRLGLTVSETFLNRIGCRTNTRPPPGRGARTRDRKGSTRGNLGRWSRASASPFQNL